MNIPVIYFFFFAPLKRILRRRFVSFVAMCCVNGVLHVLLQASPAFRESGHMDPRCTRREPFVPLLRVYPQFPTCRIAVFVDLRKKGGRNFTFQLLCRDVVAQNL